MAAELAGGGASSRAPGPPTGGDEAGDDQAPARAALAQLRRWGGDELAREMAGIFLTDMPPRLAAARAALAGGDGPGVAFPAHSMKSSSAQLGATVLHDLCAAVESLAGSGELARAAPLLDAAGAELARFSAWLEGETGVSEKGVSDTGVSGETPAPEVAP